MLSIFPELLFLAPFSALLIRVALAGVFAYSAWVRVPNERMLLKVFGVIDAVVALMLFGGLYTQLVAIVALVCTIAWLSVPSISPFPKSTVALALVLCISLLVTGPGPFAFDLPL